MARIKDEAVLMDRVLKMLPKGIPAEAVAAVEYDPIDGGDDGYHPSYWIYLRNGYHAPGAGCHTIHEDTLRALREEVRGIFVVQDDEGGYEG